jgi:hypothetical protein
MRDSERAWIEDEIQRLVKEYGAIPPPWFMFPDQHPLSIGWRMGAGEGHIMVFSQWWKEQDFDEAQRIEYFRRWPPPPRWLEWMIDAIWDIGTWEDGIEIDYDPYFKRTEQLGFGTKAEFERDFNDPKWLPNTI